MTLARTAALLVAALGIAATAAAAPPAVPPGSGFSLVRSLGGIDEYRLDANGLTVLLAHDASAPVVTFNVTYLVGSRNEVTGTTGATHLLEHLMFKGSRNFESAGGNSLKQYVERVGGNYNATTSTDRTHYFATVGRDALQGYIQVEADRMRNLSLRESDRQSEMTVVRNEFERGKNDPDNVLIEEVRAAAYEALPYHHPTIGWRSDIEHVPIERLREFYDTFYWPNNATVTVAGDFVPAQALGWIREYYGGYSASPKPIPPMYTEEPEQSGARRVTVKRPGELGTVLIAHKVPVGLDPDQAPLAVLDAILGDGKSARLYRELVDKGLALNAGAGVDVSHDLSLHMMYASLAPGAKQEEVEKALWTCLQAIQEHGVSVQELERVKHQWRAQQAYKRDGTAGVVSELNEYVSIGDWTLYVKFPEMVQKVTAADVQRVARRYFSEDTGTTGWFVPTRTGESK
ncbi:MAG: insulinase family protein [Proteobacteria bacterium]|nr:insulinase family protein [Pseudomonadota bacterium]